MRINQCRRYSYVIAIMIAAPLTPLSYAQSLPDLAKFAKKLREMDAAYDSNAVIKNANRLPAADVQTVQYSSNIMSGLSHPTDKCVRAVAKACSLSYQGLSAPTCVIDNVESCGLYPAVPGGDVNNCFNDAGSGTLNASCRKTQPAEDINVSYTQATLPFGTARPYSEQYKVLYDLYKIPEPSYMWNNIANRGCTRNAGKAGKNIECAVNEIEKSMTDAAGHVCAYDRNAGISFNTASDAYRKIRKTMPRNCSIKPDVLKEIIPDRLKVAYSFR